MMHPGRQIRLHLTQQGIGTVLVDAGESRDGLRAGASLGDEQWLDELFRSDVDFPSEGPDMLALAQAA
jgi:hypothetical protein